MAMVHPNGDTFARRVGSLHVVFRSCTRVAAVHGNRRRVVSAGKADLDRSLPLVRRPVHLRCRPGDRTGRRGDLPAHGRRRPLRCGVAGAHRRGPRARARRRRDAHRRHPHHRSPRLHAERVRARPRPARRPHLLRRGRLPARRRGHRRAGSLVRDHRLGSRSRRGHASVRRPPQVQPGLPPVPRGRRRDPALADHQPDHAYLRVAARGAGGLLVQLRGGHRLRPGRAASPRTRPSIRSTRTFRASRRSRRSPSISSTATRSRRSSIGRSGGGPSAIQTGPRRDRDQASSRTPAETSRSRLSRTKVSTW